MNTDIAKRWEKIEADRQALIARIEALTSEQRTAKPADGGFAAVEIPMHFALTEEYNLAFLRKRPTSSLKGKRVWHGPFFGLTVNSMKNPTKALGTMPFMIPRELPSLEEGVARWNRARAEFATFFEQAEDLQSPFIKMMFLFGTLSANDYLDLLESHQHYHSMRFPA